MFHYIHLASKHCAWMTFGHEPRLKQLQDLQAPQQKVAEGDDVPLAPTGRLHLTAITGMVR